MSEYRPDDPSLEDGLREALSRRAGEQPRAEIDARILAAAHRAVDSRPRPTGARRWFPRIDTPLATAAVVMVSAALLVLMREQGHFDSAMVREISEQAQPSATPVPKAGAAAPASAVSAESQSNVATTPTPATAADLSNDAAATKVEAVTAPPAAPAATAAQLPSDDVLGDSSGRDEAETSAAAATGKSATPAPALTPLREEAPTTEPVAPPPAQAFPGATANEELDALGSARDKSRRQVDQERPAAPMQPTAPAAEMKSDSATTMSAPVPAPAAAPEAATPMLKQAPAPEAEAPSAAANATMDDRQRLEGSDAGGVERAKAAAPEPPRPLTEQERALKVIRDLIAAGRYSDARMALARFAKAYPDYRLPADIIAALKPAD